MLEEPTITQPKAKLKAASESFENLRSLMLGEEYERAIKALVQRSDVDRVADVISEAFQSRNLRDQSLARAVSPVVESAIEQSIEKNPKRITEVIYPIIGPAVRKSVASALADMVNSLNYLLQQSLSVRALSSRFKAWRLGVPFGQYLLLQNLQYRVEQVFLIDKETGLLIQSAMANGVVYQDPSLVSSMLSAITDFISDSFEHSQSLNEIQFGELSLLIESGPKAVLAFAVRGNANETVKQCLQQTLEAIHQKYAKALAEYDGDNSELEQSYSLLESALLIKSKESKASKPWLAILILAATFIGSIWLAVIQWQQSRVINHSIQIIKQQPGYQFVGHEVLAEGLVVELLRSPDAISIEQLRLLLPKEAPPIQFNAKLTFLDDTLLVPMLLEQRYQGQKPLKFSIVDQVLVVSGHITQEKLDQLKRDNVKLLFDAVNLDNVKIDKPVSLQQQNNLRVRWLIDQIKNQPLYFESGSDVLDLKSSNELNKLIHRLKELLKLAGDSSYRILQVSIVGFSDHVGGDQINYQLSQQRALVVANAIRSSGIDGELIANWGSGSQDRASVPSRLQRRAVVDVLYNSDKEDNNDQ